MMNKSARRFWGAAAAAVVSSAVYGAVAWSPVDKVHAAAPAAFAQPEAGDNMLYSNMVNGMVNGMGRPPFTVQDPWAMLSAMRH